MPVAKPLTALQIARFGHVALTLRAALKERGWDAAQFNKEFGKERGNAGIYNWLNGKGAPNETNRVKIAKMLHLTPDDLAPREVGAAIGSASGGAGAARAAGAAIGTAIRQDIEAAHARVVASKTTPPPPVKIRRQAIPDPQHMTDVLGFTVASDGTARIRLDVMLPIAQAMPLLRMLLDAGVVFSEP